MGSGPIIRAGVQQPQGPDPGQIVQLALAVKNSKMQEQAQEKSEATQQLNVALELIKQGLTPDSASIEKPLKTLGIKLDDINAMIPQAAPGGSMSEKTPIGGDSVNTTGMGLAQVAGGAQVTKAPGAAPTAPGGGANQVLSQLMNPQNVNQLADNATQKFGALAPLYQQAMDQRQLAAVQARHQQQVEELKERVLSSMLSGNPDFKTMGMLQFMSDPTGKGLSDEAGRSLLAMAGTPAEQEAAKNFMLGAESPVAKSKRQDDNFRVMASTYPDATPEDLRQASSAITAGNPIPADVEQRIATVQTLGKEAESYQKLITVLPASAARVAAQAISHGIPLDQALPKGMVSLAEQGLKIDAGKLAVEQQNMGINRDLKDLEGKKFEAETARLNAAGKDTGSKDAIDNLAKLAAAEKAGMKLPSEYITNVINDAAEKSGMSVDEVQHWYGVSSYNYSPKPDQGLASSAAGKPQSQVGTVPTGDDLVSVTQRANEAAWEAQQKKGTTGGAGAGQEIQVNPQ
jgi:hypothetical protein